MPSRRAAREMTAARRARTTSTDDAETLSAKRGMEVDGSDGELERVATWFAKKRDLPLIFSSAVRRAIDDVIDGPQTRRWSISQLEKTEKTYVGTRVEIVVRAALGLEREGKLDTHIEGVPVDIKWSLTSGWEIPSEAIDEICLLIGLNRSGMIDVGLLRCRLDRLTAGMNKDGKRHVSAAGRLRIHWLVEGAKLEPNFFETLDVDTRSRILAGKSGQERVRALFTEVRRQPVPRAAIETVGTQRDPMRRLRRDRGKRLSGVRVLSGRYHNALIQRLGHDAIGPDDFISFPENEVEAIDAP